MPEVILTRIPLALERSTFSNKSFLIARRAASSARPAPGSLCAEPKPIIAWPISDITVLTSAKSTLIKPGEVIISEMPITELRNTSFAAAKASINVAFFGRTF